MLAGAGSNADPVPTLVLLLADVDLVKSSLKLEKSKGSAFKVVLVPDIALGSLVALTAVSKAKKSSSKGSLRVSEFAEAWTV